MKLLVEPSLHKQSGFHERGVADATPFPVFKLLEHNSFHARMKYGVQAREFGWICKDDGSQFGAVNLAAGPSDVGTEFAKDFIVCRLPRFRQLMRDRISCEDAEAQVA